MKKRIVLLALVVVMVLLLCGCNSGKGSLLGKWTTTIEGITISREFKDDGTIIERVNYAPLRMEGTYTTDGDKITIAMTLAINEESGKIMPLEVDWEFSYSVKGNKLVLIDLNLEDGEEVTYTKE